MAGINRSKAGLRERARSTNQALPKSEPGLKPFRQSAAKELRAANNSIKSLRSEIKGSATQVGSSLGGRQRNLKSRSTVQDTVRKVTPKAAARKIAAKGGNQLQQRAAANKASRRDMRRSSTRNAAAKRMMAAVFG